MMLLSEGISTSWGCEHSLGGCGSNLLDAVFGGNTLTDLGCWYHTLKCQELQRTSEKKSDCFLVASCNTEGKSGTDQVQVLPEKPPSRSPTQTTSSCIFFFCVFLFPFMATALAAGGGGGGGVLSVVESCTGGFVLVQMLAAAMERVSQ